MALRLLAPARRRSHRHGRIAAAGHDDRPQPQSRHLVAASSGILRTLSAANSDQDGVLGRQADGDQPDLK
jgi:hypothetical protein